MQNSTSDVKLMLIGNKIDNEQKRQVTTHQGQQVYICTNYVIAQYYNNIACQGLRDGFF